MEVAAVYSRASTEEEGTKKYWQQEEEVSSTQLCVAVWTLLDADIIQGTSSVHFHTCEPTLREFYTMLKIAKKLNK